MSLGLSLIAIDRFDANARADLRREFDRAAPFPHLVLEDMLRLEPAAMDAFPAPAWDGWVRYEDDYQPGKLCATDLGTIPEPFASVLGELAAAPFLSFLETVTGIPALIPDPYLVGGGLHSSGPGGVLQPHTDFHVYERLHLYRRINALLYLNPDWDAARGGCLELYDAKSEQLVTQVVPTFGTLVIFGTDDRSVHGFTAPIIDGYRRNSIATYYYTSAEAQSFSGDYTTYWRRHRAVKGFGRVRFGFYRLLLRTSRGFSLAAHLMDPNHGRRWLRGGLERRRRARNPSSNG